MLNHLLIFSVLLILHGLYIVGLHRSAKFEDGDTERHFEGLLAFAHKAIRKLLGYFWTKPFFGCCECMASVHSTYIYFPIAVHLQIETVTMFVFYPAYVFILSATAGILNMQFNG